MNNLNVYSQRNAEMTSSSMLFPVTNNQPMKGYGFLPAKNIDSYQMKNDNQGQLKVPKGGQFVMAEASRSMININSGSAVRRATMGKLDLMARKVTPAFQQEALFENKKNESPQHVQDKLPENLLSTKNMLVKRFSSNVQGEANSWQPEVKEPAVRKRRESIDLGIMLKKEQSNEIPAFMRRQKNPEENKVFTQLENQNNNGEVKKPKNFQFLKKRREDLLNEQPSFTASTIVPTASTVGPTASMIGVQNVKNPNQFQGVPTVFKKPEFLMSNLNKYTPHLNTLQIPDEKQKGFSNGKGQLHGQSPNPTNFEFKKKKAADLPNEPLSARPFVSKQLGKNSTMKQKWAIKVQREIKLQDFQMLEKLGKGAFGDVYIAQQKAIGFICVIKKMSKKRIRESKVEQHILREIKIQSYLNHSNLTALFGYFHDEEHLYLILQALPDGSLQNVKKKKKLPQKQAVQILKQVTDGLKYMHEQYIIHRDLKPQNIFVNEGVIKIGDFGCSIYNRDLRLRNTVVGCLEYSSPEQLSQQGYSQKIDSWSLGILTYQLLFGKSPFESQIIKMAKNKEVKPELSLLNFPPGIPIKDETKKFIENLLDQDPYQRMDMDEVLNHEFMREELGRKPMKLEQF